MRVTTALALIYDMMRHATQGKGYHYKWRCTTTAASSMRTATATTWTSAAAS